MQLTPAQIGMLSLLGHDLPFVMPREWTLADRVRHGRESLVHLARTDFEYDPAKWHEHLRETNAGGYRWSNKHLGMPKRIAQATSDPEWCAAVKELRLAGALDRRSPPAPTLPDSNQ